MYVRLSHYACAIFCRRVIFMYVYIQIDVYVCTHTLDAYRCIYVYTHTYRCIYVYTHTYTHTHTRVTATHALFDAASVDHRYISCTYMYIYLHIYIYVLVCVCLSLSLYGYVIFYRGVVFIYI